MPRLGGMLRREVAQVHAERRQQEERSLGKPFKCHEAEEDGASRPRLEKPEDRPEDERCARLHRQLAEAVKGGSLSEEKASRLRQKVEEVTTDDVAARLRRLSKNQAVPPGIANVAAPFRSRRRSAGYSEEHSPTRDGAGLGLGYDRQRSAGISDAAALRPTAADRTPPRARVSSEAREGISALMRGTTKLAWGVSEDATAAAAPATSQPPGVLQTSVWERLEPSRRWQGQGLFERGPGFTSSALAAAAVDDRARRGSAPTDDARDAKVPGATAKRAGATGAFPGGGIGYMF